MGKTCGSGTKTRTRKVTKAAKNGGTACPALKATQKCNTKACPVNCAVSGWGVWTKCSKTCGSGTQFRTRKVTKAAKNGGTACPAHKATQKCNTHACAVNCAVSGWGVWTKCSKT